MTTWTDIAMMATILFFGFCLPIGLLLWWMDRDLKRDS